MPLESRLTVAASDDDNLFAAQPAKRPDSVDDRFGRELAVIFGGTADAVVQAKNRLPELAGEAVVSAALGFGLRAAEAKLPWIRPALAVSLTAFTLVGVKDLIAPGKKIGEALSDSWRSGDNQEANRAKFADSGGKFVTDLAVTTAFGLAGSGIANKALFGAESNYIRIGTFEGGKSRGKSPRMKLYSRDDLDAKNFLSASESTLKLTSTKIEGLPHTYNATAFVASEDGLLVTNQHVVQGKKEFHAISSDGNIYKARVLAQDNVTDLAVLKIDAAGGAGFKPLPLTKTELKVGDRVVPVSHFHGVDKPAIGPGSITSIEDLGLAKNAKSPFYTVSKDINQKPDAIREALFGNYYSRPGASGSPLLNNSGEAAGVILGDLNNRNYGISIKAVNKILLEARLALNRSK